MLRLYHFITRLSEPLFKLLLRRRQQAGKENAARLDERMGIASKARPSGALAMIHAASVGEAQSTLVLINRLLRDYPDLQILVTTGTITSAQIMENRLPEGAFHQFYPLDHPAWCARFLDHWRPDFILWIESEIWPNMLRAIRQREIPAALVNARLSDQSFWKWKLVRASVSRLLRSFQVILAQTERDTRRFASLGHNHVVTTDNLKYSSGLLRYDEADFKALSAALHGRPVWLYASSHKGEEELALRVHEVLKGAIPDILTIVVPRHPERSAEILRSCYMPGLNIEMRGTDKMLPAMNTDFYIADTLGELGLFYRVAPIACIGRSFSDDGGGGHNPIEAAQLHCAVLHGPHIQYQKDIYDDMHASGAAIEVPNEHALTGALLTFLQDPEALRAQQERGHHFAQSKAAVIDRVWKGLAPVLEAGFSSEHSGRGARAA